MGRVFLGMVHYNQVVQVLESKLFLILGTSISQLQIIIGKRLLKVCLVLENLAAY